VFCLYMQNIIVSFSYMQIWVFAVVLKFISNPQSYLLQFFRLHQMHEMQTIVSDVCSVCLSVCPSVSLSVIPGHSVQP